jgi:hypothetical protein
VRRDHAARVAFFHQENAGDHEQDGDSEHPETIDIGEHGGLLVEQLSHQRLRLPAGFMRARAARDEQARRGGDRVVELR